MRGLDKTICRREEETCFRVQPRCRDFRAFGFQPWVDGAFSDHVAHSPFVRGKKWWKKKKVVEHGVCAQVGTQRPGSLTLFPRPFGLNSPRALGTVQTAHRGRNLNQAVVIVELAKRHEPPRGGFVVHGEKVPGLGTEKTFRLKPGYFSKGRGTKSATFVDEKSLSGGGPDFFEGFDCCLAASANVFCVATSKALPQWWRRPAPTPEKLQPGAAAFRVRFLQMFGLR